MAKFENKICYICTKNPSITKEDVLPRCLFPDSLKINYEIHRIILGACQICNNHKSKMDEQFRDCLSICNFNDNYRDELFEKTKRKLIKSPRYRRELLQRMEKVSKQNISKEIIDKFGAEDTIKLPDGSDDYLKTIFRGFHTFWTDIIVSDNKMVEIYPPYLSPKDMESLPFTEPCYKIKDVVELYDAISADKKVSLWKLRLYNNPEYIALVVCK